MSEAAITLPLDVVKALIDWAEDTAPDHREALDIAIKEVAQVEALLKDT